MRQGACQCRPGGTLSLQEDCWCWVCVFGILYFGVVWKYRNKYRTGSIRASWWDYGRKAAYFVTICSQDRACYFGYVENKRMVLSGTGVLAEVIWNEIPLHRPQVTLGQYVVMPNHMHGILFLDPTGSPSYKNHEEHTADDVETGRALSLSKSNNDNDLIPGKRRFQNIGKNTLSSIVGAYKSAVTKHANRLGLQHGWQPKFFDRIIRSGRELQEVSEYINDNPAKWEEDEFYGEK